MAVIRFEAWTRPESGTFERKFPIRGITDYDMEFGIFGRGSITLPTDYPNVDSLLSIDHTDRSNDEASIIRAYEGETHLYDFYASRMTIDLNEAGNRTAKVTGGGPGSALERTKVRQYDYPELPSAEPDWQYGFGPNLVKNGSFEEASEGIENPGAEEGSTVGWYTTGDPQTAVGVPDSFEAVNSAGHTGSWYFEVTGDLYQGARQDFSTIEDEDYPVTVWVRAASGQQYRVSVDGAKAAVVGTAFNNSVYVDGTGDGTWQNVGMTFTADNSGTGRIHITSRATNQTFQFDDVSISGKGIGADPWVIRGEMTAFEASTTYAHSGTYSLKFRPSSGIAGNDKPSQSIQVKPGMNIAASIWVYHTEGSDELFRLVLVRPGVDPNTSNIASVQATIPTDTWTEITASGVSTLSTIEVEARWDGPNNPVNDLFLDDVVVYQGRPPANIGFILDEMLTDASTGTANRDALSFLTPTFTTALDSNGVAWDQEISIVVKRGQSLRRLIEALADDFGYEFRIRPNPADHTVLWFDAYNPDGLGTDFTATNAGAITMSGVVSLGPIVRREPQATYAMVEGADQQYGEALNLVTQGVWGDIEAYEGTSELLVGTLQEVGALLTTGKESETITVKFVDPNLVPGIDYDLGDLVYLTLGESVLASEPYRVIAITVDAGDPDPVWQVQFASEAATV